MNRDSADGFVFACSVGIWHVGAHFDDPHFSVTVELECEWVLDHGLVGDGFYIEVLVELEGFERGFGVECG